MNNIDFNQNIDIEFDKQHIWHPYTSMTQPLPSYPVQSAEGVYIILEDGTKLIDGMASWWSVIHGYNHPQLNQAVTQQLEKVSHVMFGGLTHQPAVELCQRLVAMTPTGLDKVFLSDSGSVAVEVAMKMAIQCQLGRGFEGRNQFIALKHAYHGDTFGAMSVCDPDNSMHSLYQGILPEHYFVEAPQSKPWQSFNPAELDSLKQQLEANSKQIAALILEPIVQGAGGMRFYHPDYLLAAKQLCEQYGVLLIADEIATGFGRTGKLFACEHANISPDILCLGKAITGGYMSLAATLCSQKVAEDISQCEAGVFMHGPTFMGNPLACATANASLAILEQGQWQTQVQQIEAQLRKQLTLCETLNEVHEVRVLGAIGVIEMKQAVQVADIQKRFIEQGVWIRPFGKLIYIMPQYVISESELTTLTTAIFNVLKDQQSQAVQVND